MVLVRLFLVRRLGNDRASVSRRWRLSVILVSCLQALIVVAPMTTRQRALHHSLIRLGHDVWTGAARWLHLQSRFLEDLLGARGYLEHGFLQAA